MSFILVTQFNELISNRDLHWHRNVLYACGWLTFIPDHSDAYLASHVTIFYISAVLRLFGFGVPPNIEGRMENSSYKSPHNIEYVILSNDIDWNLELLVVKHGIA